MVLLISRRNNVFDNVCLVPLRIGSCWFFDVIVKFATKILQNPIKTRFNQNAFPRSTFLQRTSIKANHSSEFFLKINQKKYHHQKDYATMMIDSMPSQWSLPLSFSSSLVSSPLSTCSSSCKSNTSDFVQGTSMMDREWSLATCSSSLNDESMFSISKVTFLISSRTDDPIDFLDQVICCPVKNIGLGRIVLSRTNCSHPVKHSHSDQKAKQSLIRINVWK